MYPRATLNEFFPQHLRWLMGEIKNRVEPKANEQTPFRTVLSHYTTFDLTIRLPELIKTDPQICAYLLWCVDQFEERQLPHILFNGFSEQLERVKREIVELRAFLKLRQRMAMRPARI